MNQQQLIEALAEVTGQPKATIKHILDGLGSLAPELFNAGREISLPGLGKLKPKAQAERQGRNPATGAPITIPERRKVSFSPAKALKDALA